MVQDEKDLEVSNRLTANFWLPEKMPLVDDIPAWQRLTQQQRALTMCVFMGLAMLDTVQATVAGNCQIQNARTEHEEAVCTNIAFMQSVHARLNCSTPVSSTNQSPSRWDVRWPGRTAAFAHVGLGAPILPGRHVEHMS